MAKYPISVYVYFNVMFSTVWPTNLNQVIPRDLHTKYQSCLTSSFQEDDFWTKTGKNGLKNTKLQISSQFEQIWLRSSLGTCIPNIKAASVWPAVLKKKNFWPKITKISSKTQICRFHHNFNKSELGHPQGPVY